MHLHRQKNRLTEWANTEHSGLKTGYTHVSFIRATPGDKSNIAAAAGMNVLLNACNGYHGSAPASVHLYSTNIAARCQAKARQALYTVHRYNYNSIH